MSTEVVVFLLPRKGIKIITISVFQNWSIFRLKVRPATPPNHTTVCSSLILFLMYWIWPKFNREPVHFSWTTLKNWSFWSWPLRLINFIVNWPASVVWAKKIFRENSHFQQPQYHSSVQLSSHRFVAALVMKFRHLQHLRIAPDAASQNNAVEIPSIILSLDSAGLKNF